ncbi:unnamed protein product, partial [Pocillopora meandrina]
GGVGNGIIKVYPVQDSESPKHLCALIWKRLHLNSVLEGSHLQATKRIVRGCISMEVEEYGHYLKVGERSSEKEDDEEIEGLDDLREGAVNTKRITHIPITLESSEQGTQYEDGDAEVFTSLISSDSDFEVGFLPFKKRKRVHVYKLNSSLCFRQMVVEDCQDNIAISYRRIYS